MKLLMIIFMACLSHSKSQESTEHSPPNPNASSIPIVEEDEPRESTVTTSNEKLNDSTHLESPHNVEDNILHSNKEMSPIIGNDPLKIIPEQSVGTNQTEKDAANSLSSVDYWGLTKSKLQCAWNKLMQISSRTVQSAKKAVYYIGNKFKQLIDYMNQGQEIVESLQEATEMAGEATKNSESQSLQIINSFVALLKQILKILKTLLKTDPIEIAKERESLAE
ncbi:uncharacterized protein LOC106662922 isoform X2 [Cimex lectularius]|uniref:Uncharacterized protein n=1 Tax=Cimex lectularius TaxID=79782 RepID=A0A8I6RGF5_CIMLE|nr:uncharacterized protein LOC106662922 isoform X2 [Cimex lectularius]XP_024085360.1 uncharacterized protein LOC106662922 isoform X2 [Cimex lectularius]